MPVLNFPDSLFWFHNTFFRKTSSLDEISEKFAEKAVDKTDFSAIRCPLCKWQPKPTSRWICGDAPENLFKGCFISWNTFETRGLCPGCSHQWKWTTCLSCHRDSPHESWYFNEIE